MYFANSRARTKKSKKGSITGRLKKNGKRNHIKCSTLKTKNVKAKTEG